MVILNLDNAKVYVKTQHSTRLIVRLIDVLSSVLWERLGLTTLEVPSVRVSVLRVMLTLRQESV
jgi:hypothetical protein